MMTNITLNATVTYPSLPYEKMKIDILGRRYMLEVSFVGVTRAKHINARSRQKSYAPNVLSFPYTKTHGEIVICPQIAKREAAQYGMTYCGYLGFLFVHGLLHLKGYDHGVAMETLEKKYVVKYDLR